MSDRLFARAFKGISYRPFNSSYDKPQTLSYQIRNFGFISADVRRRLGIGKNFSYALQ